MVPAILAAVGVPILVQVLGDALGKVDHPAAKGAAQALGQLDDVLMRGQIDTAQVKEANRHTEAMAQTRLSHEAKVMAEINKTLRTDNASEDKFVRRMRPTFGYLMAATWTAQMMAVAYIMVFRPAQVAGVLQAAESLSVIWTVGLSVLGIYVYRRSDDKRGA